MVIDGGGGKNYLNSRERLTRCYFNQELDRPAVYSWTGYPENDSSYDGLKAYIAKHADMKMDWSGWSYDSSYPIHIYIEPYSEDFEREIKVLHTPAGALTSSTLRGLKGQPGLDDTYLIKTAEDAGKYLSLPLPQANGDVSSFWLAEQQIGDRGIVNVGLGFNPAGYVAELMGSETFAILSATDRDVLHALCERQMNVIINTVKFLLERNIGPFYSIFGEEYIVPPLHGPVDFFDFNVRYDKPIIDLIHNSGGRVYVHCHGSIKKVIHGFLEMGVDVLHPFEAPPMGDITAVEAKNAVMGRMCLEGNIQISAMYEHTPQEICDETTSLIRDAFSDHKGLIVSPTASPYIPGKGIECFEQYKAMIDTVLKWKD